MYMYKGCYSDSTNRDLNVTQPNIATIQECAGFCSRYLSYRYYYVIFTSTLRRYDYFGVQDGGQCYCGDSYPKFV